MSACKCVNSRASQYLSAYCHVARGSEWRGKWDRAQRKRSSAMPDRRAIVGSVGDTEDVRARDRLDVEACGGSGWSRTPRSYCQIDV